MRRLIAGFTPLRRTALRVPPNLEPPPPAAYAHFGEKSWVIPPAAVIGADRISIGDHSTILEHAALCARDRGRITIGNGVRLTRGVTIVSAVSVTIEDRVSSSDGATIVDCWDHIVSDEAPASSRVPAPDPAPVVIEEGAYLGAGSVVLPGVRVGRNSFVGEGAVVATDVPAQSIVYGNPARVIREFDTASGWQDR
jgi:acetyltransferase-like isoleucine patch superfamily enzyme